MLSHDSATPCPFHAILRVRAFSFLCPASFCEGVFTSLRVQNVQKHALCFHIHTNCFCRISPVFTFMQLARGWGTPESLPFDWRTKVEPSPAAATPMSTAGAAASRFPIVTPRSASATPNCPKTKSILTTPPTSLPASPNSLPPSPSMNSSPACFSYSARIASRRAALPPGLYRQPDSAHRCRHRPRGPDAHEQTQGPRGKHAGDSLRSRIPRRRTSARSE
jgi:hypothetical protein